MRIGTLKFALVTACTALTLTTGSFAALEQQSAPATQERNFLSRVRRLTVEGKRAGEGYWAPDGKRLVFQSERDATNPFYQIYVLDLTSGDTKRISPGMGKTTCAFFRPNSSEI
jgi:Tol biopolymer transport system component